MRIEVVIRWGGDVIHAASLPVTRAFALGERRGDFAFPRAILGSGHWPLLTPERGATRLTAPDGQRLGALAAGTSARFELGAFTIEVRHAALEAPASGGRPSRFGAGLAAMIGLIGLFAAYLVPPLLDHDLPGIERTLMLRPLVALDAPAEPDPEPLPLDLTSEPFPSSQRIPGHGRCGELEEPGMAVATGHGRYGISGPKDNPDPHVARAPRAPEPWVANPGPPAASSPEVEHGAGGLGDPYAHSMPWGRDTSLGTDDRSAQGELFGDVISDAEGVSGVVQVHRDGGIAKALAVAPAITKNQGGAPRLVHTGLRVRGALAATKVHALMARRFAALRACYLAALGESPRLAGKLDVNLVFSSDGPVSVDIPARLGERPAFMSCMRSALSGLALADPPGAATAAVYPLFLSPGSGTPTPALHERRTREARTTSPPCSTRGPRARTNRGGSSAKLRPCKR